MGVGARLQHGPWRLVVAMFGTTGSVLLSGVVTAKLAAVLLGPDGLGRLAIAQAVVMVSGLLATLSVHEGLVRFIAVRAPHGDTVELRLARRVSLQVIGVGGVVVGAAVFAARSALGPVLFPGASTGLLLGALAGGLLYAWSAVLLALPTAYRRVELYAVGLSISAVTTPVVSGIGFWLWGAAGIPLVVAVSNACSLAAAMSVAVRLDLRRLEGAAPSSRAPQHARRPRLVTGELLGFGVPQMLSHLTDQSFVLVTPLLVQEAVGAAGSGYFRAAATASAGMGALLGFLIGQELFTRLAALHHDGPRFTATVNRSVRVVALGGGLLAVVGMGAAELLLRVLFSAEFTAAATVLRWLLLAEVVRLVTLLVTSAVSVHRGSTLKLVTGLCGAVASAGATAWLVGVHGLAGAGEGPLIGQLVAVVVAVVVAARGPSRLTASTWLVLALAVAVLAAVFSVTGSGVWWLTVLATVAAVGGLGVLGWGDFAAVVAGWAHRHDEVGRAAARGRVNPPAPPALLLGEGPVFEEALMADREHERDDGELEPALCASARPRWAEGAAQR